MENLYQELANNIHSGAAVSISQYLREFERISLSNASTKESLIFHLFACYITDQLSHARLLWKRTPNNIKIPGELDKVWELGKHLINHEHAKALHLINSYHWILSSDVIKILKTKLISDSKRRISSAYTSIPILKISEQLGINENATLELLKAWGWNTEYGYVFPTSAQIDSNRVAEERDIEVITELVGFLEQKYHIGISA